MGSVFQLHVNSYHIMHSYVARTDITFPFIFVFDLI